METFHFLGKINSLFRGFKNWMSSRRLEMEERKEGSPGEPVPPSRGGPPRATLNKLHSSGIKDKRRLRHLLPRITNPRFEHTESPSDNSRTTI
jgi:hypothetical protein